MRCERSLWNWMAADGILVASTDERLAATWRLRCKRSVPGGRMRNARVMAAALSLLLLAAPVAAQDFPSKPIKLIVPFPPGGPNDIIARVVGQRMTELTKQPIVIENRSGQA